MIDSGHAGGLARYPAELRQRHGADYAFRMPAAHDASSIAGLIAACPPLDTNSLYCNLLQCTHFASTCIIAEQNGTLDGWMSAYRPPDESETLFIWQVAVHERARGCGLAIAMLERLLERSGSPPVRWLKTTVTPSNEASRRMFSKFAQWRGAAMQTDPWFDRAKHFGGSHESEELISIGPL